jgi:hypothetical protein
MSRSGEPFPPRTRWSSFVADPDQPKPRILYEESNPQHRIRVEHKLDAADEAFTRLYAERE